MILIFKADERNKCAVYCGLWVDQIGFILVTAQKLVSQAPYKVSYVELRQADNPHQMSRCWFKFTKRTQYLYCGVSGSQRK